MIEIRRGAAAPGSRDRPIPDSPVGWRRLIAYLSPYRLRLSLAVLGLIRQRGLYARLYEMQFREADLFVSG